MGIILDIISEKKYKWQVSTWRNVQNSHWGSVLHYHFLPTKRAGIKGNWQYYFVCLGTDTEELELPYTVRGGQMVQALWKTFWWLLKKLHRTQITQLKWTMDVNRHFSSKKNRRMPFHFQEDKQMVNKHKKRCSTPSVIR